MTLLEDRTYTVVDIGRVARWSYERDPVSDSEVTETGDADVPEDEPEDAPQPEPKNDRVEEEEGS